MTVAAGLSLTAALLVVGAGLAKLASPATAVAAMRATRLPSSDAAVRTGACVELALGALVLTSGSWVPRCLLALSYVGFAAFSLGAIQAGGTAPCGCFGRQGSVIGWRHVLTDLVLAAGLGAFGAGRAPSASHVVAESPALGVAGIAVGVVAALLVAVYLSGPVPRGRVSHA